MGFHNPGQSWGDLEATLSGRRPRPPADEAPRSHRRGPYAPPADLPPAPPADALPYAELHAHSSFSFLDGVSSPERLVEEAARLGLSAIALTDHDGFYGAARFAEAAEQVGIATVHGAELSLGLRGPQNGAADPEGDHLLVLAAGEEGYHRLSGAITAAQLAGGEKGRPVYDLEELAARAGGRWEILTGCRKGAVRRALGDGGDPRAAGAELDRLVGLFGRDHVHVELVDHGLPLDSARNDALAALAAERGLPVVATGNAHYATPAEHRLATATAAVRARRSLDELDGWLPAAGEAHLRDGREMRARFARYPGAVDHAVALAERLAFPLRRVKPPLPRLPVPEGHTPMSYLRSLVWEAAPRVYPRLTAAGRERIERELEVIERKDFPGYFLIVKEIVDFARGEGILCQGRGSAAASAVCYLLGITAIDAIGYDLPFERFLSTLRDDEEPDIDVDFDSERREEVIQWVYRRYGRENAAQVANVIQYRPKNAIRDMAKALGHSPGQQDAWSKQVERWGALEPGAADDDIPAPVKELANRLLRAPRHLGIHSGGMVLTGRPVGEVVPVEHARMANRTVVQWDKDDCATMGLVKFDLLGVGMLTALSRCLELVAEETGEPITLQSIPKEDPEVYEMLGRGDALGVFQVESRAQLALLPRLKPENFYDLAIEIALIRPGPIQGDAVHPFVRRKNEQEPVTYLHPKLEPVLARTLGIPVFQEQLMQMAMAVGNLSAADADLLRRAMGSKRGLERMDRLRGKLYAGMAANGIPPEGADKIYRQIEAFVNFGFAESHSLSFALLVYASAWLKRYHPAAFLAGLLRAQPMGFYSPTTLVADARRHGVEVRRPDLARSGVHPGLEPAETGAGQAGPAVRLGLAGVRGIGRRVAERIVAEREEHGAYASMDDLVLRTGLDTRRLEALATAGALENLGLTRRAAVWGAGAAARNRAEYLPGTVVAVQLPLFSDPSALELLRDDRWATGVSVDDHPLAHLRAALHDRGVLSAEELLAAEPGRRIRIAGAVIHRQRPATASGITFVNLEDETGLANVICSRGLWARHRRVWRDSAALVVRGVLERSAEGVVNVLADDVEPLELGMPHRSRDFQ